MAWCVLYVWEESFWLALYMHQVPYSAHKKTSFKRRSQLKVMNKTIKVCMNNCINLYTGQGHAEKSLKILKACVFAVS